MGRRARSGYSSPMDAATPAPALHAPDTRLAGPWRAASAAAGLLRDGEPTPTVFEETTARALRHDAVNLGQGFPDQDGPDELLALAADAVRTVSNQYEIGRAHV